MSGYREDRRIDAIARLTRVSKNEASEMTDVERSRRYELEREAISVDIRKTGDKPTRSFADLVKKKP
jgi:hypothetical protein